MKLTSRFRCSRALAGLIGLLLLAPYALGAFAASAEQTYMRDCAVCHLPGIAGAPKVGDKAEWARRVRTGVAMVYRNAIEGLPNTAMAPKGGHTDLSDTEIKAIVDYMLAAAALGREVLEAAARYEKLGIQDRDFIRFDTNHDGFLSPQELAADPTLRSSFNRFDENRDGKLSPTEYRGAELTLEKERAAAEVDDASLVREVRAALGKLTAINLQDIKIEADHGVIAMIGLVSNADAARQAYAVVKRIRGIKKIDSRLVSGEQMGWD